LENFDFAEIWFAFDFDLKVINRVANHSKGQWVANFYKATRQVAILRLEKDLPEMFGKNKTIKVFGGIVER